MRSLRRRLLVGGENAQATAPTCGGLPPPSHSLGVPRVRELRSQQTPAGSAHRVVSRLATATANRRRDSAAAPTATLRRPVLQPGWTAECGARLPLGSACGATGRA